MKIIGIIARKKIQENNKYYIGVYENYLNKIIKYGGVPIIIYPSDKIDYILNKCDGILSPGGDDVDEYDKYIYKYTLDKDIPYLGICLGMQAMSNNLVDINNHYMTYHQIYINSNSKLYQIYKKNKIIVNSRHKSKIVSLKNHMISAISEDGVVEAIERIDKKFILGVQYHPEDLTDDKIFEYFINSC